MPVLVNLVGKKFGRLTVVRRAENDNRYNKVQWLCRCDCGNEKVVYANRLQQRGNTASCGCWWNEKLPEIARSNFTSHGLTSTDEYEMWSRAKGRAKQDNIPFAISIADIVIPDYCPALGIKLVRHIGDGGGGREDSPSLDRLLPDKGYVPGNIRVISNKANTIKQRATAKELLSIAQWLMSEFEKEANE